MNNYFDYDELAKRAQTDERAKNELFELTLHRIIYPHIYFKSKLMHFMDRDDLAAIALARINTEFKYYFRSGMNYYGWAIRHTRCAAQKEKRRIEAMMRHDKIHDVSLDAEMQSGDTRHEITPAYDDFKSRRLIMDCRKVLDGIDLQIFELHVIEGYDIKEIAKKLGLNPKLVYVLRADLRKRLREMRNRGDL